MLRDLSLNEICLVSGGMAEDSDSIDDGGGGGGGGDGGGYGGGDSGEDSGGDDYASAGSSSDASRHKTVCYPVQGAMLCQPSPLPPQSPTPGSGSRPK